MLYFVYWIEVHFNPRSRKGATRHGLTGIDILRYFNPRSRKGATTRRSPSETGSTQFQSTLPQGSDKIHNIPLVIVC